MPHGYYSLEGEFVETGTKEEATVAWRKERGYSTTTTTAASNLARTLTGIDRSAEVTARAGVRTPATTSFVRRPVEPVAPLPSWWGKPTGGGAEPVAAQPGFVRRPVTAPVRQPQTSRFGEPIDLGGQIGLSFADVPLGREPYRDERRYDLSSRFGIPSTEATTPESTWQRSIDFGTPAATSAYQGPTGQVGPNEFVVTELSDVGMIARTAPGINVFYANPTTGELVAKSGTMAYVPALIKYLEGEDMPDSVVQTLVRLGLLEEGGAVTTVGSSLAGSGGKSIASRFPLLTGSSGRFVGTYRASLVNWRV